VLPSSSLGFPSWRQSLGAVEVYVLPTDWAFAPPRTVHISNTARHVVVMRVIMRL